MLLSGTSRLDFPWLFWLAKNTVQAAPEIGQPKALSCWYGWSRGFLVGQSQDPGQEWGGCLGRSATALFPRHYERAGCGRLCYSCSLFLCASGLFHSEGNSPRRTGSHGLIRWAWDQQPLTLNDFGGESLWGLTHSEMLYAVVFFLINRKKLAWLS